jgi:hypothetical protein
MEQASIVAWRGLGIRQIRTPFRSPRANAVAERWVRSARSECLDHLIVFSEANLRRILSAYVTYYNRWRPHRSLGQAAPCGEAMSLRQQACRKIAAAHTATSAQLFALSGLVVCARPTSGRPLRHVIFVAECASAAALSSVSCWILIGQFPSAIISMFAPVQRHCSDGFDAAGVVL